jgi:hypothetical protein
LSYCCLLHRGCLAGRHVIVNGADLCDLALDRFNDAASTERGYAHSFRKSRHARGDI